MATFAAPLERCDLGAANAESSLNGSLRCFAALGHLSAISPVKCFKNEIHNILTVLKLTKQFVSPNRFRYEVLRDEGNPLVQSFQALFDSLTYVDEFHVDEAHLRPFLDVIESPSTSGGITAVALDAINKFVVYGLVRSDSPNVARSINMLAAGVLNAQFPGTGLPNDEVVMLKILTVLIDTLRSAAGKYLTDEAVWKMVKKAYQISRQPQISHLLRCSSETILQKMVLTIFGCHKTRSTQLRRTPNPADPQSLTTNPHVDSMSPSASLEELDKLKPYGLQCMLKALKFFAYLMSYGARDTASLRRKGWKNGVADQHRAPTPSTTTAKHATVADLEPNGSASDALSSPRQTCLEDELALPFVRSSAEESLEFCEEMRTVGLSLLNIAFETGGEEIAKCPLLVEVIRNDICKFLALNSRSQSLFLLSVTLRCVFNMFVYLRQHLKVQFEVFFNSIQLRAALAYCDRTGAPLWEQRELALESLLEFCREPDLMVELYQNYDCDVHCTNLFEDLVFFLARASMSDAAQGPSSEERHKENVQHLEGKNKLIDVYNENALNSLQHSSLERDEQLPTTFSALQRLALSGLLCVIRSIASRCHVEYSSRNVPVSKAEKDSSSLFCGGESEDETPTKTSDKKTPSLSREKRLRQQKECKRRLELGAKLFNIDPKKCIGSLQQLGLLPVPETAKSMAEFLKNTPGLNLTVVGEYLASSTDWNGAVRSEFLKTFNFRGMSLITALRDVLSTFRLPGEAQQIERLMEAFAHEYFFAQPVVPTKESRLSQAESSTDGVEANASFPRFVPREPNFFPEASIPLSESENWHQDNQSLLAQPCCEKTMATALTTCDSAQTTLEKLSASTSGAVSVVEATGSAPQESVDISAEGVIMHNTDTVFILSYSIIMLNTDLHNSQVKNKMTLQEFVRNNRGIDDGHDLPTNYLSSIYESIASTPIRLLYPYDNMPGLDHGSFYSDEEYWAKLLGKQSVSSSYALSSLGGPAGVHERDMFAVVLQAKTVTSLLTCFEVSQDIAVIEACLAGLLELSWISCYYALPGPLTFILDSLNRRAISYWVTLRTQLAVPVVVQLFVTASHFFRAQAWGCFIEVLLKLFALGLLPLSLMEFDDFPGLTEATRSRRPSVVNRPPALYLRVSRKILEKHTEQFDKVSKSSEQYSSSGWLITSLKSLLFAVENDHTSDDPWLLPNQYPSTFCAYTHAGTSLFSCSNPSPLSNHTGTSPSARDHLLFSTNQQSSSAVPTMTLQNPSSLLHSTASIPTSVSSWHLGETIATSPCPYFCLKNKLTDVFRLDELLMNRFRRLPFTALSGLVLTLASLSLPKADQQTILEAIQRGTPDQENHVDTEPSLNVVAASYGERFFASPHETDNLLIQLLTRSVNERHLKEQQHPPPATKTCFVAVRPNLSEIQDFRKSIDTLFCLELLTNLICVRLHFSYMSNSSADRISGVSEDKTDMAPPDTINTTQLLSTDEHTEELCSSTPLTFLNVFWPLITVYFSSLLSWYTVDPEPVHYVFPFPQDYFQEVLPLPSLTTLTPFPDAIALVRLLHFVPHLRSSKHQQFQPQSLLFLERLMVSVLRLCVRLSHAVGDATATGVLCHYLALIEALHPQFFSLHTERVVAALSQLWPNVYGLSTVNGEVQNDSLTQSVGRPDNGLRIPFEPLHNEASKILFQRNALTASLLSLCERCAPLYDSMSFALGNTSAAASLPSSGRSVTPATTHAILDMIEHWFDFPGVLQHLWHPSVSLKKTQLYLLSNIRLQLIRVLVVYSLCPPVLEASQLDSGPSSLDHSSTLKAVTLLRRLADEGDVAAALLEQGRNNELTEEKRSETVGISETISYAVQDAQLQSQFSLLQALSVVASFTLSPAVRGRALEMLLTRLERFGVGQNERYDATNCRLYIRPKTWHTELLPHILLPLISYCYPSTFLDVKKEKSQNAYLPNLDSFLTLSSAQRLLGVSEVCRRKAHAAGFVSRHLLHVFENLLRYGPPPQNLSDATAFPSLYGDELCFAVVAFLVQLVKEAVTTSSQSVQESCWETFKNTILVLAVALSRDPFFDLEQQKLSPERFIDPLLSTLSTTENVNEFDPVIQWIAQYAPQLDVSVVILRLGYGILRRAVTSPAAVWETIVSALPPIPSDVIDPPAHFDTQQTFCSKNALEDRAGSVGSATSHNNVLHCPEKTTVFLPLQDKSITPCATFTQPIMKSTTCPLFTVVPPPPPPGVTIPPPPPESWWGTPTASALLSRSAPL